MPASTDTTATRTRSLIFLLLAQVAAMARLRADPAASNLAGGRR